MCGSRRPPLPSPPSLPSCDLNDNWEVSKRDKRPGVGIQRLIPGIKCGPGFGGQSGEGKAGAAVDSTATPFIGGICWSHSLAPAPAPLVWGCGHARSLAVIKVWNNFPNLTETQLLGGGREELCYLFAFKLIKASLMFKDNVRVTLRDFCLECVRAYISHRNNSNYLLWQTCVLIMIRAEGINLLVQVLFWLFSKEWNRILPQWENMKACWWDVSQGLCKRCQVSPSLTLRKFAADCERKRGKTERQRKKEKKKRERERGSPLM